MVLSGALCYHETRGYVMWRPFLILLIVCVGGVGSLALLDVREANALPARLGAPDYVYHFDTKDVKPKHRDMADSDGRVPTYQICGMGVLGRYSYRTDRRGHVEGVIRINVCALKRLSHPTQQRRDTIAHERAHALGWDHWEGSPRKNPGYFP